MRTWTEVTLDLQDTMPMTNAHKDCVSMHYPGYMRDSQHGRGFTIHLYPCHIDMLKGVIEDLEEIKVSNGVEEVEEVI